MVNLLIKLLRAALPVNDITTDWEDIPQYLRGKQSLPRMVGWCKWAYADVQPLRVQSSDLNRVVELAAEAASAMRGWTVREQLPSQGLVQALSVTPTMKFKDDVIIRVRQSPGSSSSSSSSSIIIDTRSRSRVGTGDMGANGARILAYQKKLRALLAEQGLQLAPAA